MARLEWSMLARPVMGGVAGVAVAAGAVYGVFGTGVVSVAPLEPDAAETSRAAPGSESAPDVAVAAPSPGMSPGPSQPVTPPAPDASAGPESVAPPGAPGSGPLASPPAAPEAQGAAPLPDVADTAPGPRFDLVRAEPDGSVLVAGTAGPGERVRIDVDGAEAASGRADGQGGFVFFVDLPQDGQGRVLDLVAIGEDGEERRADGSVVIAPSLAEAEPDAQGSEEKEEIASVDVLEAVPAAELVSTAEVIASIDETGRDGPEQAAPAAAARIAPQATGGAGETVAESTAAPVAGPPTEGVAQVSGNTTQAPSRVAPPAEVSRGVNTPVRAPAVLLADSDGVRMLQPSVPRSRSIDRVIVDIISYAADGAVLLEGRSAPPPPPVDSVRVYLDGTAIDSAPIAEDGSWRLPLVDIQSGVYTLRVDQLDPAGRVVSRFETPFKREDPVVLAQLEAGAARVPGQTPAQASVITVQPGYTLWGIAADRYGSGFRYVQIFAANDDQIRDPDLIYPGQIFDLPDIAEEN